MLRRGLQTVIIVAVPDPKPTPVQITFSITQGILEVIYTLDEVWEQDYYNTCNHLRRFVPAPILHGYQASEMFSPSNFSSPAI